MAFLLGETMDPIKSKCAAAAIEPVHRIAESAASRVQHSLIRESFLGQANSEHRICMFAESRTVEADTSVGKGCW